MTDQTTTEAFVGGVKLDVPTALCMSIHMAADTLSSHGTITAGSRPVNHSLADRPNLSPDCREPRPRSDVTDSATLTATEGAGAGQTKQ
ncbi:MAG: hypothetical protein K2M07_08425 [Muribaculaceae bacterium]|nr:hypothetical protein [Muribaculaceae bacterium]